MSTIRWLMAASVAALLPLTTGCVDLDCGEGTVEQDGVCRPADSALATARCGPNTHLEGVECVPDQVPTVCDADTTDSIQDNESGVTVCQGTGGTLPCGVPLSCPPPADPAKTTICGQLLDLEDSTEIAAPGGSNEVCTEVTASGPCSLKLQIFPALPFASEPTTTPPLVPKKLRVDQCGRFRADDIEFPTGGFVAVGVDEAEGAAADVYRLSGGAALTERGVPFTNLPVYVLRRDTDERWSEGVEGLNGQTFGELGVFVSIFIGPSGAPTSGVAVTRAGATVDTDDFYFSDEDPLMRTTIDPDLNVTGANGTALMVRGNITNHSGEGGDIGNCAWPSTLAKAIPGVVFTTQRIAVCN